MIFPKKRQARAWCVSLIYRKLIRKEELTSLDEEEMTPQRLGEVFNDDTIFLYKGDVIYFRELYNAVRSNIVELLEKVYTLLGDERGISDLIKASGACALAEANHILVDRKIVIAEYIKLLHEYGEDNPAKLIKKIIPEEDIVLKSNLN